jgi:polar amino acid transport system substrate-binding protein
MLRMLMAGRLSLVIADPITIKGWVAKAGLSSGSIRPVYSIAGKSTYIAFSRQTPAGVVADWQHALDQMKRDGRFNTVFTDKLTGY